MAKQIRRSFDGLGGEGLLNSDPRQLLLDLIQAQGARGKWLAAAKDEGFLDAALPCARDSSAEPAVKEIAQPLVGGSPTEGNPRQGEVFERRHPASPRESG
jgi:hypothetical protein